MYPLRTLPSESLPRLFSQAARGDIIEVRLHRQALQQFLHHLKHDSRSETEIRTMIAADASHPFMRHFYGMTYAVYHQHRQQAGLLPSSGRPASPDQVVLDEISGLLEKLNLLSRSEKAGPFDLLAIHQLTGHSLRDVWWVYDEMSRSE
ncbi:MAG: STY4526/YPO1902 family pathogenicity island replication protein [Candidatus Competibacteraceae bacterium]